MRERLFETYFMPLLSCILLEEEASSEEDVEAQEYVTSKVRLNLNPFVQHTHTNFI
jgi:hypothetical protein